MSLICLDCISRARRRKNTSIPKSWRDLSLDEWLCFRERNSGRCGLIWAFRTVEIQLQLEESYNDICFAVCGMEIEGEQQFKACLHLHCPVAIKMQQTQFAVDMGFTSYLSAQFKALNSIKLQLTAKEFVKQNNLGKLIQKEKAIAR